MARTLIEPQLQALEPPAAGDLAATPLAELVFAHAAAGSTGTIHLRDEQGTMFAMLRMEAGALVAASVPSPDTGLLPSVIPLCARGDGRFSFAQGADVLGTGPHVVRGKVDALTLIAAAMRGPVREDAIDAMLMRLGNAPLWRNPRIDLERYGFGAQELAFVRQIDGAALSAPELLADPPCAPHIARRVLYVLAITRALSSPLRNQQDRQVSGTIARQSAPPRPRTSKPPRRAAEATVVIEQVGEPKRRSVRPPRSRRPPPLTSGVPPARSQVSPKKKAPAGRYSMLGEQVERVVGVEPRGGAPRRALPSALAWRDELRERAKLVAKQSAWDVLGVAANSEIAALHEAHTALVARFSPESLPDADADATREAKLVLEHARRALDVLADPVVRAEYERATEAAEGQPPPQRVMRGLHAEVCYRRAEALWKRRDYAAAQHECERALGLDGGNARYEALLGLLLHLRSGSGEGGRVHPSALRHLEHALRLDPRNEQANYAMALVLKRAGRHDEAYQHFHRVWRQNPGNLDAAREVRLHQMRNREKPSSGLFGRMLGRGPKNDDGKE